MPPTSVMTRLILIMVWRKLIRNPNTYSSLIGLTWSLISYRFADIKKRRVFHIYIYFIVKKKSCFSGRQMEHRNANDRSEIHLDTFRCRARNGNVQSGSVESFHIIYHQLFYFYSYCNQLSNCRVVYGSSASDHCMWELSCYICNGSEVLGRTGSDGCRFDRHWSKRCSAKSRHCTSGSTARDCSFRFRQRIQPPSSDTQHCVSTRINQQNVI